MRLFSALIIITLIILKIDANTEVKNSSFDLRTFHQNSVLYGGPLDPQMQFWAKTDIYTAPNQNVEGSFIPVYVLPLGNSSRLKKSEQDENEKLSINQAQVGAKWNFLKLTIGRQIWNFGDGALISSQSWKPVKQYFDGADFQLKYNLYQGNFLIAGIERERNHYSNGFYKKMYGSYNQFDFSDLTSLFDLQLDLFYLIYQNPRENKGDGFINTIILSKEYGGRLSIQKDDWYVKCNYVDQRSKVRFFIYATDIFKNYMSDIKFGKKWKIFEIYLGHFSSSKNYVPFYSEDHNVAGGMDLFQRRNITGSSIGINWFYSLENKINLSYSIFKRKNINQNIFRSNGERYKTDKYSLSNKVGSEIDLRIDYKIPSLVTLYSNGGVFMPNNYIKDNFSNQNVYQFILGTTVYL